MECCFNFDKIYPRRGTDCVKWDASEDPEMLPMWVADMDFPTAPPVTEAVRQRAQSGIFGYVKVPESYYKAVSDWFSARHGWCPATGDIIYIPGIVPALSTLVQALVPVGKGVIFQTPAYNCFFSSVTENGRRMVLNPLERVETESGFTFRIDFDGLEKVAAERDNVMLILCNPHNPTGRVWTRDELRRVSDICRRNDVIVVSDEIHCEIVHPGERYIPFATIDPECVTCCSPTKGFNIAGLMVSNIIAPRADLRERIRRVIRANESDGANPFGIVALQAAYREGAEWLDALNGYLYGNYRCLREYLSGHLPAVRVCESAATYLAWVDIRGLGLTSDQVEQRCKAHHVWVNSGDMYGGTGYIRINYACPRGTLLEGLARIVGALSQP